LAQRGDGVARYRFRQFIGIHAESGRKSLRQNNNLRRSAKCFQLFAKTTEIVLFIFPSNIRLQDTDT
jgi:hypothetical protein